MSGEVQLYTAPYVSPLRKPMARARRLQVRSRGARDCQRPPFGQLPADDG